MTESAAWTMWDVIILKVWHLKQRRQIQWLVRAFSLVMAFVLPKVTNMAKTMVVNDGTTRLPSIPPLPLNGFRLLILGFISLSRNKGAYSARIIK